MIHSEVVKVDTRAESQPDQNKKYSSKKFPFPENYFGIKDEEYDELLDMLD